MSRKKKDLETNTKDNLEIPFDKGTNNEVILNEKKYSKVKKDVKEDVPFFKSRFLANSIAFYSFLLKKKKSDEKILSFIYLSLIIASELKIHNNKIEEFYSAFSKKINNYFDGNIDSYKNFGVVFFIYLISENPQKYGVSEETIVEFNDIQQAVELISEVRKGRKKSEIAIMEFIRNFSKEINITNKFIHDSQEDDPFLKLSRIKSDIFKILDKESIIALKLKYRIKIVKSLWFILENSTKDPKDIVMDFLSKEDKGQSELDILLFALFIVRFFYDSPYDKTIPLAFIDHHSMNFIAPLVESFINPKFIIQSSKKAKVSLDEYFWFYVRNSPKSIFEDEEIQEIEITQKIKRKKFGEIIVFDF